MSKRVIIVIAVLCLAAAAKPDQSAAQTTQGQSCVKKCTFHYDQNGIYTNTTCDSGDQLYSCQDSTDNICHGQLCIDEEAYSDVLTTDAGKTLGVVALCGQRRNEVKAVASDGILFRGKVGEHGVALSAKAVTQGSTLTALSGERAR